jgi:hypothetical protein
MTKAFRKTLCFWIPPFAILFFFSCGTSEETMPSYVQVGQINLITDSSSQGSSASNISDAWVYMDDTYLGTYSLPALFPVLAAGIHTLKVSPGIKINGSGGHRTIYPFYTSYTKKCNFTPKLSLNVDVHYASNINFLWIEDFENTPSGATITLVNDPSLVFEGKRSGAILLDNNNTFGEFKSNSNFALPKSGAPIFLELNYKTNLPFTVGLYATINQTVKPYSIGGGNPSTVWKKIYFDLAPIVQSTPDALNYKVFISMQRDSSTSSATLYLDNIKLVCSK